MSNKKMLLLVGVLMAAAFVLTACAGPAGPEGPAGPAGPAGAAGAAGAPAMTADLTCSECHNDTDLITAKTTAWDVSLHGTGEAYLRASSASCAGCHSGSAFSGMVAAGLAPDTVEADLDPTRQDCRACHQIHTTYTSADWGLETTSPVAFYAAEGVTFDGGMGNLCATCHQPRGVFTPATDGNVEITSVRYGPHHGPQSSFLLGTGGALVEDKPGAHYTMVENTCVACHLGDGDSHTFTPQLATCVACHADAESFDINGLQTAVEEKMADLKAKLLAAGFIGEDDYVVVGVYTEAQANAIWNYRAVLEDKSMGVHNPSYTNALLDAALAVFP